MSVADEANQQLEARVTRKENHMPACRHLGRYRRNRQRSKTYRRSRR